MRFLYVITVNRSSNYTVQGQHQRIEEERYGDRLNNRVSEEFSKAECAGDIGEKADHQHPEKDKTHKNNPNSRYYKKDWDDLGGKKSDILDSYFNELKREKPPKVPENVRLVVGFFDDSLPMWIKRTRYKSVAFLHIDSDLYSSAKTVLHTLNHLIKPGTIIVFDELCDWAGEGVYPLWREGEWKALLEWMEEFDREVTPISRTNLYAAAVKVKR